MNSKDFGGHSEWIETRSLPTLTHYFPRNFTFYVAHPVCSIREQAAAATARNGAGNGTAQERQKEN